jgi:hypothetical protein
MLFSKKCKKNEEKIKNNKRANAMKKREKTRKNEVA